MTYAGMTADGGRSRKPPRRRSGHAFAFACRESCPSSPKMARLLPPPRLPSSYRKVNASSGRTKRTPRECVRRLVQQGGVYFVYPPIRCNTMNSSKEKIVFISAHPDDAEGFAATAFPLRDRYELHVVDLTHGELGLGRARQPRAGPGCSRHAPRAGPRAGR